MKRVHVNVGQRLAVFTFRVHLYHSTGYSRSTFQQSSKVRWWDALDFIKSWTSITFSCIWI